ncbi:MAG TPA: hypothetical protein VF009_03325 [Solirubrobacterales bacterium]
MIKKIILLALAAASLAAFALPATAMAVEEDEALHVIPAPEGAKTVDGVGEAKLTANFATVTCKKSHGTSTFTSSTTGTFEQTFEECSDVFGTCTTAGEPAGDIVTTPLTFHLVTVEDAITHTSGPGVLITPNATTGVFAHFECPVTGKVTVEGTGLIGTITKIKHNGGGGTRPPCEETQFTEGNEATVEFSSSSQGVQTHKKVYEKNGTETGTTPIEYFLKSNGGAASEDAEGTITLGTTAKLECT